MAMTKRTDETRASRQQAEVIVDLFLEVALNDRSDIAWESRSIIGALVDFKGQIPRSSGFSGFCKLAGKIDRLHRWSDTHLLACMLMRNLSDRQREALAYDRFYRGRVKVAIDPLNQGRIETLWDDGHCARHLECTVSAFRQRITDGYASLENSLQSKISKKAA